MSLSASMCQRLSSMGYEQALQRGLLQPAYSAPRFVLIELTHRCNLHCLHCYNDSDNLKADLDDHDWLTLAQEMCDLGVFYVTLSGGEPLLRRDLCAELIDLLNRHHIRLTLITNGWLLNEEILQQLRACSWALIVLSIDGARPETHDAIRGVQGSWQRVVEAALKVSAVGVPFRIVSTLFPANYHDLEAMIELAFTVGAQSIQFGIPMLTGRAARAPEKLLIEEQIYQQLWQQVQARTAQFQQQIQLLWSQHNPRCYLDGESSHPNDTVLINPNGNVKLDCIVPYTFGNIVQHSLADIWNNGADRGWQCPEVREFVESIHAPRDLLPWQSLSEGGLMLGLPRA